MYCTLWKSDVFFLPFFFFEFCGRLLKRYNILLFKNVIPERKLLEFLDSYFSDRTASRTCEEHKNYINNKDVCLLINFSTVFKKYSRSFISPERGPNITILFKQSSKISNSIKSKNWVSGCNTLHHET